MQNHAHPNTVTSTTKLLLLQVTWINGDK
uniref:Uncharacterized protein n=1 Tax=Anguilla anguilla TaxID=7936 RepID=A0A0E9TJR8_ANGAN